MKILPIRTHKIFPKKGNILDILDLYLKSFQANSILVVTSKIVSLCEGNIVKVGTVDKDLLVAEESDHYIRRQDSKYNFILTIKRSSLAASAGIDESNADGNYVLWPKDPQKTANSIRKYLLRRFQLNYCGVIISDSKTTPLRWGTTGYAIAHSGFLALNDYIGKKDLFGREMHVTKANLPDALAAAAVVTMGEGNEQTPLALIEKLPFVQFQDRNPTHRELDELNITIEEDLYAPILKTAHWIKGKKT